MRVGLQLASYTWTGGPSAIASHLGRIAGEAEDAGFASLWLMDHFLQIPTWGDPAEHPMLEAYTALGFVAARTSRIRLGTLVTGAVYRPPAVLVKAATTLDVLSGGRTYFGVGAAWFEREARALGLPFPPRRERFDVLEDVLRLAHHTWSGDRAPFVGRTIRADDPLSNPLPLARPRPSILVGGRGPRRTLGLVARYADAWNVIAGPREAPALLAALNARCADIGRDAREIEVTVLDPEDWRLEEDAAYRWSPEWELERLRQWRAAGIHHVIVNMSDAHDTEKIRAFGGVIRTLAEDAHEPSEPVAS